jgi:oligoendopeptidase F
MDQHREKVKRNRKFIPSDLKIKKWSDLEPYSDHLCKISLINQSNLDTWLELRSEIDSILEEDKAWLYINQSCHTDNKEYSEAFTQFVREIDEKYAQLTNTLNKKLLDYCLQNTYPEGYEIFIRGIRKQTEIFREENVRLLSELEIEEQKYSAVIGGMTIRFNNEELTLQQAQNLLKSADREVRKEAFEQIWSRREKEYNTLNELFTHLLGIRQQIAMNAGYNNFLEYRFDQLGRFDYTIKDCELFHMSVKEEIMPIVNKLSKEREEKLKLDRMRPYDLEVDTELKEPLKPFSTTEELIEKTISCFKEIDNEFGEFISLMQDNGYLDLDSRKGKAPGGYNYPLYESNIPFIFMNATNNLRDLVTMMHEGGHAIHSFLSKDLKYVYFKEVPAEVAELASMAMELISMEHWHHFFDNEEDLKRAKRSQLEGVINVLPWVAAIDKFQHWLYSNPGHTIIERLKVWDKIEKESSSKNIIWEGYEHHRAHMWQKQIHLFQFPLYYIEYGIAQLGAIAIWKNYKENSSEAITAYKRALSLGYSKTLPELYMAANIKFDFSVKYIRSLMDFLQEEYNSI